MKFLRGKSFWIFSIGLIVLNTGLWGDPLWAQRIPVIRDSLAANWSADGQRFWFQSKVDAQISLFWLVDAKRGTREPLFDHSVVGAEIARATGQALESAGVPGKVLKYDSEDDAIEFQVSGHTLLIHRQTGELNWAGEPPVAGKLADAIALFLPLKPSQANGESVSFKVTNALDDEIDVMWVDLNARLIPYSKLKKGESFSTGSYAGHVWLFQGSKAENLACLQLDDRPLLEIELNPTTLGRVQPSPPANRRRGTNRNRPGIRAGNRAVSSNLSYQPTSPSGKFKAEVQDDNLWLIVDLGAKEEIPLTTDASAKNSFRKSAQRHRLVSMQYNAGNFSRRTAEAAWSPNSQFLIAWQTSVVPERRVELKPSQTDDIPQRELSYPYAKPGDELPTRTLRLFDIERRTEIALDGVDFSDPWTLEIERFSSDGRFAWINYHRRGHQKIQLIRMELETGQAVVVIEETSPTFLHYSAGSKYRLWWLDETTALWSSERSGWNHLYRIDMTTGEVLNSATSGEWNVKGVQAVREGKIWFSAVGLDPDQDPYHEHFCRVDIVGENFVRLTKGDGMHSITWSPTEEFLIDEYSRVDMPSVHELRSSDGTLICELERGEVLEPSTASPSYLLPRRFVAMGRDGETPIWGVVYFPVNYDPTVSYPIIESIYAGPHDHHVPKRFRGSRPFELFTSAGFVVVQIDGMGTAWRSKGFHDVCYRNLRDAGFPDRIAWIRALAKEYPNLDLNRVGIFGGSAGGQNAMAALLWFNDFYKVAVADCGCHDNRMDKIWWNEQWMGTVEPGDHYSENSNLDNAGLLRGKLLLVVGEMDRNVDPASTLDVATKLRELGKDDHFELLAIPGAGHGAAESPRGRQRRFEFFQEHLLNDGRLN